MSYRVMFSSQAGKEAIEQAIYLEGQRSGFGNKFKEALKIVTDNLAEHPERYPVTFDRSDIRCIRMPRPFKKSHSVYYRFDNEVVRVLCVFPNRRRETIWQKRG